MGRLLDAPISGTGGWSGVAVMVKSRKHGCAAIMSHAPFDISRRLRVGVNLRTFTQTPNAEQLSANLDLLIKNNEAEFEHFIDNGLGQAPEMIYELRSSLRELQKLLRQLQEDPSQLIHRPPNDALEVNP